MHKTMTQSSTARTVDSKFANGVLNSRTPITRAQVGSQVVLAIQGSGTLVSKEDAQKANPGQANYFDKYIYNLRALSQEAMSRPENRKLMSEALKLESAGNVEDASKAFNDYLNAVQLSFNVIADSGRRFESGDLVKCIIAEAKTKLGHTALVVNDVRFIPPVQVEKTKFNLADLMADDEILEENGNPLVTNKK